jgi:hypothetical protein
MKERIPGRDYPDTEELRALARDPVVKELNAKLLERFARLAEKDNADAHRP